MSVRHEPWGPDDIGDLTGRTILVTGANSGIGLATATELAARGALTVLGCRDPEKGRRAVETVRGAADDTSVELLELDLSDLASVRSAAATFARRYERLDVLVNNAAVMGCPYQRSADGYELQLATNLLGPFALTALLLGHLLTTAGSRVVTVSSNMHRMGHRDWDDLLSERHYHPMTAYSRTKLANLLFTFELERRLRATGAGTIALAAHPGWARTRLAANGPTIGATGVRRRAAGLAAHLGQSAGAGALPVLFAATSPEARGGGYFGPSGIAGLYGHVAPARPSRHATDAETAATLWAQCEALTAVHYDLEPAPVPSRPAGGG